MQVTFGHYFQPYFVSFGHSNLTVVAASAEKMIWFLTGFRHVWTSSATCISYKIKIFQHQQTQINPLTLEMCVSKALELKTETGEAIAQGVGFHRLRKRETDC